jgi:Tol biopolymer transport system component
MSALRRTAVLLATTACLAVGGTALAPGGQAAAVRNGNLLFSATGSVVEQAPLEATYHQVAEGFMAKYSPDGRRIAYSRWQGSTGGGVFVKTLPSGVERQLSDETITGLAWAPDGRSLVVATGNRLQRLVVATGAVTTIYTAATGVSQPAWSPDGTHIAFSTTDAIKLVHPDGTALRTLTSTPGHRNTCPDWSPNSQTIAFVTDRYSAEQGKSELVTLPRTGKGEPFRVSHRSFPQGLFYIGVAWSPDGTRIAALQFNATHLPNEEDTDERFKVRGYLPDGSHSYSLTGPITGDDGPEGLDWGPKTS